MAIESVAMRDLRGFFTHEERVAIYRACERVRDEVLIRLLWKSGRRISEVLEIRVCDINFKDGIILWNILKKKKPLTRWKPIDQKTLQLLRYYIDKGNLEGEEYLLHAGNPKKHISRQRADKILKGLCHKVGIEKIGNSKPHCHHFRHSSAIDLVKKSKDASGVRLVQQWLEHSNLKMTENYLQFSPEEVRELLED